LRRGLEAKLRPGVLAVPALHATRAVLERDRDIDRKPAVAPAPHVHVRDPRRIGVVAVGFGFVFGSRAKARAVGRVLVAARVGGALGHYAVDRVIERRRAGPDLVEEPAEVLTAHALG